MQVLNN